MFDENGDGVISINELNKIFGGGGSDGAADLSENSVLKSILSEVDKDGDNEISYEEFNEAVTSMLKTSVTT